MAVKLNKSRIRDSKIVLLAMLVACSCCSGSFGIASGLHELMEQLGYVLVSVCTIGRVYATAFLGGHKNARLITAGPFSVVRNPLYVFSLVGIVGITLMTRHIVLMLLLPTLFLAMYHALIRREEEFLRETFGEEYEAYCRVTPRLLPDFRRYHAPESVEVVPRFLNRALADSCWWLAMFPMMEIIESLQGHNYLKPLFALP